MSFPIPRFAPGARIVILTGAGISKESGLDTFRDVGGVWTRFRLEDVATPEAFRRNPRLVHDFYNARRRTLVDPAVRPNAAHAALARLEREWRGDVLIVTQNVDDLHERAGSRRMIHMHGELMKIRCEGCGDVVHWTDDLGVDSACARCGAVGGLRPHVVWFGEMPFGMETILDALARADLFVSIGTSGSVYPAAGFVHAALDAGAFTLELNKERSEVADLFDVVETGPATELVPALVGQLLDQDLP